MSEMSQLSKRELHADARGWLCEIARSSVVGEIAQVYVTCCLPGAVKGWHRHRQQTDRMFCVQGMARIVTAREQRSLWDRLPNGQWEFEERVVGPLNPALVTIPPGLWHAFAPCGGECVIVNCPDLEWDGTDEERLPLDAFPFPWREVDG